MEDETLRAVIEQVASGLSADTRGNLEAAHDAQQQLALRILEHERARKAYDALSRDPTRSGPKDDTVDVERSRREALDAATAAVEKQRRALSEARSALSKSLNENERSELERLGAAATSSEQQIQAAAVAEGRRLYEERVASATSRPPVRRRARAPAKKIILATGGVVVAAGFLFYSLIHRPASPVPWIKLAATADCDCPNVSTTSWRKATIDMCKEGERAILDEAREGRFEITVNAAGRMGGVGPFCDSGAAGPIAWPMRGGSPTAPSSLRVPACRFVGGAQQWICP